MKKFRLLSTVMAFLVVTFAIGFGVYAALYNQRYISNQITFNPGGTIVEISAKMEYMQSSNWYTISTFEADNKESADRELNNTSWDKNSISPLPNIDFDEHSSYRLVFNIKIDEDRFIIFEGFTPDPLKYSLDIEVYNKDTNNQEEERLNYSSDEYAYILESGVNYRLTLTYTIKSYAKTININNMLNVKFQGNYEHS